MFPKRDGPRAKQSLMCTHKETGENKEQGKGKETEVTDLGPQNLHVLGHREESGKAELP